MSKYVVFGLANQQSQRGSITITLQNTVHCRNIRSKLTHVPWVKVCDLNLYYDIAMEARVIKEHIEKLLGLSHNQAVFFAHKCKASPQFHKETLNTLKQCFLHFPFIVVNG